jgi:hypothetical protein
MFAPPSEQQQVLYRSAFVRNCMALIVRSHLSLNRNSLETAEEPHITGELVKGARDILESEHAEPWMEHIEVLDDPPQTLSGRHGKSRPRIDIEFLQTAHGRRPRFHVEAKRLYRSDSVSEYFGTGGMQMFVGGQYAAEWPSAGMLGYVQSENCATWLGRLASGFAARRDQLKACASCADWASAGWIGDGLDFVQSSCHDRAATGIGSIEIFHLLLDFVAQDMPVHKQRDG